MVGFEVWKSICNVLDRSPWVPTCSNTPGGKVRPPGLEKLEWVARLGLEQGQEEGYCLVVGASAATVGLQPSLVLRRFI